MFEHVLHTFVHSLQHDDMFGLLSPYIMVIMTANHPNLYEFIFIWLIERKRAKKSTLGENTV